MDKADLALPRKEKYQVILANINLNTLVAGLSSIVAQANDGAIVMLSGFYEEDADSLINAAARHGLEYIQRKTHLNWAVLSFKFNL